MKLASLRQDTELPPLGPQYVHIVTAALLWAGRTPKPQIQLAVEEVASGRVLGFLPEVSLSPLCSMWRQPCR